MLTNVKKKKCFSSDTRKTQNYSSEPHKKLFTDRRTDRGMNLSCSFGGLSTIDIVFEHLPHLIH